MHPRPHIWAVCFALITTAAASAQNDTTAWKGRIPIPNENADRQKAGEVLEYSFGRAFTTCGLPSFVQNLGRLRRSRPLTRIPQVLQDLRLQDSVRELRATSLARALSYVAPLGQDPALVQVPAEERHLRLDPTLAPEYMIARGDPRLVYTYSCGTVTQAATNLKLNVVPLASAAFEAMRRTQEDLSIVVTEGPFVSPLVTLMDNTGTAGFYARHLIWDWYKRNRTNLDSGGTYRAHVNGIVISRMFTDNMEQSLQASAQGSTPPTLAFVSLNANAKASVVQNSGSRVEKYALWEWLRFSRDTLALLRRLPSARQVTREMAARLEYDVIARPEDLVQSIPYRHKIRIDGVHPDYCNTARWKFGGSYSSSLSWVGLASRESAGDAAPWIRCVFEVEFKAPPAVFQEPHGEDITLSYTLVDTIVSANNRDTVRLELPITVRAHLVDNPALRLTRPAGAWSQFTSETPQSVTWTTYEMSVAQRREARVELADFNGGSLHAVMTCPRLGSAGGTEEVPVSLSGHPQRDPNTENITIELQAPFPTGAKTSAANARQCMLSGTVEFVLSNGERVTKRLPPSPIAYPGT